MKKTQRALIFNDVKWAYTLKIFLLLYASFFKVNIKMPANRNLFVLDFIVFDFSLRTCGRSHRS